MHFFSTVAVVLSGAASFAAAAPTTPEIVPRATRSCTTKLPDVFVTFAQSARFASTVGAGFAYLSRTAGGPGSNTAKVAFSFSKLPSSGTCSLQFELPAVTKPDQFATGASIFNVFSTKKDVTNATSWSHPPTLDVQYSSYTVPEQVTGSTKTTFASFLCKPTMSFEIELADWQQNAGTVKFYQSGFEGSPSNSGFSMIHEC